MEDFINLDGERKDTRADNVLQPSWPFRCVVAAASGGGKTNFVAQWALNMVFDKLWLYAPSGDQEKYRLLKDMCEMGGIPVVEGAAIEDIIDPASVDKSMRHLVILDDVICDKGLAKTQNKAATLYVRGRHSNMTVLLLTQSFYAVPKVIRQNTQVFVIARVNSRREVQRIAADAAGELEPETFAQLLKRATREPFSFFVIDHTAPITAPYRRYRSGLNKLLLPTVRL